MSPKQSRFTLMPQILTMILIASIPLALILTFYASRVLEDRLYDSRRLQMRSLVETASSMLTLYHEQTRQGDLSQETAQQMARAALEIMRYQEDQYFWINDSTPVMIMHPIKPSLNGKNLSGLTDPDGKALFMEMVQVTSGVGGAGYVDYLWPKPGEEQPQPKISYVQKFQPWGWIVGSGVYVDDVEAEVSEMRWALFFVAVIISVVALLVAYLLGRNMAQMLKDTVQSVMLAANQFLSASRELSSASTGLSDSAGSQAANVEEVSSSIGQIRQQLEQGLAGTRSLGSAVDASTQAMHAAAQEAEQIAQSSQAALQTIDTGMANVRSIAEQVKMIHTGNEQIRELIGVMETITHQTKMLATNASIEAARAGDAGKGFAVVAGEVANLAENTRNATRQIVELIKENGEKVTTGVNLADRSEKSFQDILQTSQQVTEATTSIFHTIQEQAERVLQIRELMQQLENDAQQQLNQIGQVNQAMVGIEQTTSGYAASAEETASTAEELEQQTHSLSASVQQAAHFVGYQPEQEGFRREPRQLLGHSPKSL
jgi:methyl-accepting chemotaxis protein